MKILVICQYYTPEPFRVSDICEELAGRGHDVTVVTGLPNYPMGEIYDGYRGGKRRDEIIGGVSVHRCFTIGRKRGVFRRFLNYYSYMFSSRAYIAKLDDSFDLVFVNQLSPVMMASAGIRYKKKHGKKLILYCLDLWPESLAAGGIKETSPIYKHYYKVSKKIYNQADKILVTSKSFMRHLEAQFGIETHRMDYLPQYAEEMFSPGECSKQQGETIDLMFAGNVGKAQSVDTIIKAAALTKDIKNLRWHIVGDGSELENCRKLAGELGVKSVIFHGRKPLEEMPQYYARADAMLITLTKNETISLTLPGKVQTYMAAGKPIIGAIGGEAAAVIREAGCGYCGGAEDAETLAENARLFSENPRGAFAENAADYYQKHFTKSVFMKDIINEFEVCSD